MARSGVNPDQSPNPEQKADKSLLQGGLAVVREAGSFLRQMKAIQEALPSAISEVQGEASKLIGGRDFEQVDSLDKIDSLCTEWIGHLQTFISQEDESPPTPEEQKALSEMIGALQATKNLLAEVKRGLQDHAASVEGKEDKKLSMAANFIGIVNALATLAPLQVMQLNQDSFAYYVISIYRRRIQQVNESFDSTRFLATSVMSPIFSVQESIRPVTVGYDRLTQDHIDKIQQGAGALARVIYRRVDLKLQKVGLSLPSGGDWPRESLWKRQLMYQAIKGYMEEDYLEKLILPCAFNLISDNYESILGPIIAPIIRKGVTAGTEKLTKLVDPIYSAVNTVLQLSSTYKKLNGKLDKNLRMGQSLPVIFCSAMYGDFIPVIVEVAMRTVGTSAADSVIKTTILSILRDLFNDRRFQQLARRKLFETVEGVLFNPGEKKTNEESLLDLVAGLLSSALPIPANAVQYKTQGDTVSRVFVQGSGGSQLCVNQIIDKLEGLFPTPQLSLPQPSGDLLISRETISQASVAAASTAYSAVSTAASSFSSALGSAYTYVVTPAQAEDGPSKNSESAEIARNVESQQVGSLQANEVKAEVSEPPLKQHVSPSQNDPLPIAENFSGQSGNVEASGFSSVMRSEVPFENKQNVSAEVPQERSFVEDVVYSTFDTALEFSKSYPKLDGFITAIKDQVSASIVSKKITEVKAGSIATEVMYLVGGAEGINQHQVQQFDQFIENFKPPITGDLLSAISQFSREVRSIVATVKKEDDSSVLMPPRSPKEHLPSEIQTPSANQARQDGPAIWVQGENEPIIWGDIDLSLDIPQGSRSPVASPGSHNENPLHASEPRAEVDAPPVQAELSSPPSPLSVQVGAERSPHSVTPRTPIPPSSLTPPSPIDEVGESPHSPASDSPKMSKFRRDDSPGLLSSQLTPRALVINNPIRHFQEKVTIVNMCIFESSKPEAGILSKDQALFYLGKVRTLVEAVSSPNKDLQSKIERFNTDLQPLILLLQASQSYIGKWIQELTDAAKLIAAEAVVVNDDELKHDDAENLTVITSFDHAKSTLQRFVDSPYCSQNMKKHYKAFLDRIANIEISTILNLNWDILELYEAEAIAMQVEHLVTAAISTNGGLDAQIEIFRQQIEDHVAKDETLHLRSDATALAQAAYGICINSTPAVLPPDSDDEDAFKFNRNSNDMEVESKKKENEYHFHYEEDYRKKILDRARFALTNFLGLTRYKKFQELFDTLEALIFDKSKKGLGRNTESGTILAEHIESLVNAICANEDLPASVLQFKKNIRPFQDDNNDDSLNRPLNALIELLDEEFDAINIFNRAQKILQTFLDERRSFFRNAANEDLKNVYIDLKTQLFAVRDQTFKDLRSHKNTPAEALIIAHATKELIENFTGEVFKRDNRDPLTIQEKRKINRHIKTYHDTVSPYIRTSKLKKVIWALIGAVIGAAIGFGVGNIPGAVIGATAGAGIGAGVFGLAGFGVSIWHTKRKHSLTGLEKAATEIYKKASAKKPRRPRGRDED